MTSEKKHNTLILLGITLIFLISRKVYDSAGIVFQAESIFSYWQIIDPELLKTDLLRSVFYLHSQPPLFNFFIGIVLQVFPGNYEAAFHFVYYSMGLLLAGGIYWAGISLHFPKWLAASLSIWFMVSPATILYEHWLMYAYPLVTALTLSVSCLHQFISTKKIFWGMLFFFLLAFLALTWSLFHLIWMISIAAGLYFLWGEHKIVVYAALLPVLLVTGWYAKNLVLVGEFTSSSWAGMNLAKIITFRVSEKEREQMVKDGQISPFALIPPFRNPAVYLEMLPDTPRTGVPVLDNPETSLGRRNHHHLVYVEASRSYLKDALRLIYRKPYVYLHAVIQAGYIYFHSASDYEFIQGNRTRIGLLDQIWDRLFYGQLQNAESAGERLNLISDRNIAWGVVVEFCIAIAGSYLFLKKNRSLLNAPLNMLVLFMLYNILFLTLVSIGMDIGENNRFRWTIDPLLALLFVFILRTANLCNR